VEQDSVAQFAALYAGLTRAKGRYVLTSNPSQAVVGEKAKGKATTISETVTTDDYAKHLSGEIGLGIVPIRDDGTCVFGAIDIDQYTGIDHAALVQKAAAEEVPVSVCRSKSGGAHVYMYLAEPGVLAPELIDYLKKLRTLLGIDIRKAREIFPKQAKQSGGIGNWINLPYFGNTPRKAIRSDGTEYSLEEFLATVTRIDPKSLTITAKDDQLVLSELPPCLESLMNSGVPAGMRNEALYNFAVFATKKFAVDRPKVLSMVAALNLRACHPPLSQVEMATTIDSVLRHEYNYKCTQSPILEVCNKPLCATRPYGPPASPRPGGLPEIEKIEIRGDENNETVFYVKLAAFPKSIECTSRTLMDYESFKRAALDTLHSMLPVVRQRDWDIYITARFIALSSTMRVAPERTNRGLILTAIDDWIHQSASTDPKFFAIGRPYIEPPNLYISFGELGARLKHVQNSISFSSIARILEDSGWEKTTKTIGQHTHENVWTRAINQGTALPDTKVATIKEVDGHIVTDAPAGLPSSLIEELSWDEFDPLEEGID
jgi:hypothetical protein